MAQTKKIRKHEAILSSAYQLFREKGFIKCRMAEIAKEAGTAVANIYVYFPSKLHLFYEIFAPKLELRMLRLAHDARGIDDREERLRFLFITLWRDIPREDNAFASNLMQAIVTAPTGIEKPHEILKWCEELLNELIRECLPANRHFLTDDTMISFLAWMAFDGFVINVGKREKRDIDSIVDHFANLLLGKSFAR